MNFSSSVTKKSLTIYSEREYHVKPCVDFVCRCSCNGDLDSNGKGECNSSDQGGLFCYVDR